MELFKAFYKYNSQTVTDKIAWCRSSQCRHFKYKLISDEAIKRQHLSAESYVKISELSIIAEIVKKVLIFNRSIFKQWRKTTLSKLIPYRPENSLSLRMKT